MLTLEEAKNLVLEWLRREPVGDPSDPMGELVVIEESTQEHEFGWVFFSTTRGWREDTDLSRLNPYAVGGNAPVIVERETGQLLPTGTARPLEHYLQNYRETGDPHRAFGAVVRLLEWRGDGPTTSSIAAIRDATAAGLSEAKSVVDRVLDGVPADMNCTTTEAAELLAAKLTELGWRLSRLPE